MSGKAARNEINVGDVLLIVFIILKLIGVINWSWWWVLSPLWFSLAIVLIVSIGCALND